MQTKQPHMIAVAQSNDAEAISSLVNRAYRGDSARQGWTSEADLLEGTRTDAQAVQVLIQSPETVILKYSEANEIIGCVELGIEKDKMYLGMLTVCPDHQGKGVGKKMMLASEEKARELQCQWVYMTVISDRKELIAWYEKYGYHDTGHRKPFQVSDPRFGIPLKPLEFVVLEKKLVPENR